MAVKVAEFPKKDRDLAVMYARVRDAVRLSPCSPAERIAVLELVKSELVRDCQQQIDDGA